jgi:hypothetical protein
MCSARSDRGMTLIVGVHPAGCASLAALCFCNCLRMQEASWPVQSEL